MTDKKKIGVSKIVINIGDKEAALTVEQAKELRDALNAVLGEKVVERVIEHDHDHYHPYPYTWWTVYCDGSKTEYPSKIYGNISGNTVTNVPTQATYTISLNAQ